MEDRRPLMAHDLRLICWTRVSQVMTCDQVQLWGEHKVISEEKVIIGTSDYVTESKRDGVGNKMGAHLGD